MYGTIVRKKVVETFDAINQGDYATMVEGLDDKFSYRFHGDHALGGFRCTKESMTAWWERVFRLLPGARFTVEEVIVSGGPRRTRLAVTTHVQGDLPDGSVYDNVMVQLMTLRWGKVTEVETLENLQELQRALDVVAAHGKAEAHAEPIEDPVPERSRS